MFIFIGCLLAIDIPFLIIVTAVPQAILTVTLNERPLLVRYVLYIIYVYIHHTAYANVKVFYSWIRLVAYHLK